MSSEDSDPHSPSGAVNDPVSTAWDAFLSYSHADSWVAERIHAFLQEFPLPPRATSSRRRLRIFRDRTDIRARKLGEELPSALARSSTLLVVCSQSASASGWVNREVESYLKAGHGEVIPLLVSGDVSDALPEALRSFEPLVLDLRDGWRFAWPRSSTRLELLRAVAGIADIPLRELVPWDLQRRRRRATVSLGIGAAVLAIVSFVVVGWLLERQGAESLASHRRAQGALVQLTSGDAARAVASLGYVVSTAGDDFEREYGKVLRFWIDRLEPIDRVVALADQAVTRQAGRSFFVLAPKEVREIKAEEPFEAIRAGRDRLLIVGRNEVQVLTLPEMAITMAQSFPARLRFQSAALDASGKIVVIAASQIETTGDEDEPDEPHRCHVVLLLPDAGHASVSAQNAAEKPGVAGGSVPDDLRIRRLAPNGETLLSNCVVSIDEPSPAKNAPTVNVASPTEQHAVKARLTFEGIDSSSLRRLEPLAQVTFPRIRPEREMWQSSVNPYIPPKDRRSSMAPAFDAALERLRAVPDPDFDLAPQIGTLDECMTGCGTLQTDTGVVVWSVTAGSNSGVIVSQCTVPNAPALPTCQPRRSELVTLNASHVFSPDDRWMSTISRHMGAPAVELFDFLEYRRVRLSPEPSGQVLSAVFEAAAQRLYLLTENDELWQFSRAVDAWSFSRRIPIGTGSDQDESCRRIETRGKVEAIEALPVVAFNSGIVVTVSKSCMLVAADASTGELRWRAPLGRPGDEEQIRTIGNVDSDVVAVTVGSRLRLFHVGTGTPLSEPIDLKDLFSGPLPHTPDIRVELSGEVLVGLRENDAMTRRAPPGGDVYKAALRSLQNRTGISVSDGRSSIVTLPAK